ncbi:uncharacterized oxidoreductase YjmC isoform X2 [Drosophila rhopaloa]|uniref:Uncharacterized oxidoreductase YjmC isoform X2 n=1 Tax=Drosophila rhopaloa TaxID=1041015 RepID=A0A6P4F572_DRORH|nr:uncharacterized oxidoreductase YjmC isoform X2 [Drosophila rhopaloa]
MLPLLRPAQWLGSCFRGYHMPVPFPQQRGETSLVLVDEARRFIQDCLMRVGVSPSKVRCISEFLVVADYRGNFGHGLNRLDVYLSDLQRGYAKVDAEPTVISETVATAHVNGNSALGVLVGNFCMDLAVKKAQSAGIGFVVARESHHFGMASWYAFRAAVQGLAGMVMSNSAPTMMAPNSKSATIGPNCLAFCVKAGGHKGYCMSAVIDLLCGVLSGAQYATHIPLDQSQPANLGQVFIALDPAFFLPNFMERLDDFCGRIQNSQPAEESNPIRLPGELERMHMNYVEDLRALPYPNTLLTKYKDVAFKLCVKPIELAFERCQSKKSF